MPGTDSPFDPETYAAATAPLLGIDLDEAWAASISANLRVLASAAALLTGFPLPDDVETAQRFEA